MKKLQTITTNDVVQLKPTQKAFGDDNGLTVGKRYVVAGVSKKWNLVTLVSDDLSLVEVGVDRLMKCAVENGLSSIKNFE